MKYLLLFAFLAVVWWLWAKRREAEVGDESSRQKAPEKMVTCAHCSVNFPESDGVAEGDRIYCSEAHRMAQKAMER